MAALGRVHGAGFGDVGAVSARVPDSEGTSFLCVFVYISESPCVRRGKRLNG